MVLGLDLLAEDEREKAAKEKRIWESKRKKKRWKVEERKRKRKEKKERKGEKERKRKGKEKEEKGEEDRNRKEEEEKEEESPYSVPKYSPTLLTRQIRTDGNSDSQLGWLF